MDPPIKLDQRNMLPEKSEKYFGHKPTQIWSFQGVVLAKKNYFLTRNAIVIYLGPGEAQIGQLYRKNIKNFKNGILVMNRPQMVSQTLRIFTRGFYDMLNPILMVPGPQNNQKYKF